MTRYLLGALALLLAVPAQAQWVEDALPAPAEAPPTEGIQVHGRWHLTVRDADGAVVEERVFQNALTPTGAFILTGVLVGALSDPLPIRVNRVRVGATSEAEMPCTDSGTGIPCYLAPPGHPTAGQANVFATLVSSPIGSGLSVEAFRGFVLRGSFQAQRDAAVDQVATVYNSFSGIGIGGVTEEFTLKTLDAPLSVAQGQTVDVRVEITFE